MRRRSTLPINIAIVLSLAFSGILSGILVPTPVATGTGNTSSVVPGDTHSDLTSRGAMHDRKQKDRQHNRKQKDRKSDRKKNERQSERKKARKTRAATGTVETEQVCTEAGAIWLPETQQCTHGPDPAPPGRIVNQPVPPLSEKDAHLGSAAITCDGSNGTDGYRVQVLYVRGTTTPSRYARYLASFKAWSGHMNKIFQSSAAETNGDRSVRFVQDSGTCEPIIPEVVVPPDVVNDFGGLNAELRFNKGFNSTQRFYLLFVDATEFCGVANWPVDDQPGSGNAANTGPRYARVDSGCWSGDVAAHELMHNLGGVQDSAPHTSYRSNLSRSGAHCVDEWDVMCYSDHDPNNNLPPMTYVCMDGALDYTRFDCGNDDYFNANPLPGNYLSNHWNPANNRFLIGANTVSTPPVVAETVEPVVNWFAPVGNDQQFDVGEGTIALRATATDAGGSGVEQVEFWRYDNVDQAWLLMGVDTSASSNEYEFSVDVASLGFGVNWLSADAHDAAGNWTYELIKINLLGGDVSPPPPTVDASQPPPPPTKDKKHKKKKKKGKGKKRH